MATGGRGVVTYEVNFWPDVKRVCPRAYAAGHVEWDPLSHPKDRLGTARARPGPMGRACRGGGAGVVTGGQPGLYKRITIIDFLITISLATRDHP